MQAGFAFSKLADRLSSLADLSAQDLDLLGNMPSTIVHLGTHQTMVRHHSETDHCCLLLQGYLCWRVTTGQDAQITSIYVPGDVPDLHTLYHPSAGTNLVALGSAITALVPHDFFHELCANSPAMSRALLLMMLTDLAIQRNWTVNLGSRDALCRVAHLLCEITERLRSVGLARDFSFPSPFTQSDLAAACGISPVHANRTIQELRRRALLQWHGKNMTITDWSGLVRLAGFDPAYLRTHAPGSGTRSPQPAPASRGVELA
jgi:CRP-like cAMP-binding protein